MINVIRDGDKLLNADVISPEFIYATFNEGLSMWCPDVGSV